MKWGLKVFVVSDWNNLKYFIDLQKICSTPEEAAKLALEAGNDMTMITKKFPEATLKAIEEGSLSLKYIDRACSRILKVKFELGLFDEKRYPELEKSESVIAAPEHLAISYKAAAESIVLLENRNCVLPLNKSIKKIGKIAIVGPNASDIMNQMGDWSFGDGDPSRWVDEKKIEEMNKHETFLQAFQTKSDKENYEVKYVMGCDVSDSDLDEIDLAVEAAVESDVTIAFVGDSRKLTGEYKDRAVIELTGKQQLLLERLKETGKPLVVVLVSSKPLAIPWIKENADTLIATWNPGTMGAKALADLVFGEINFSGKLTVSFPYHVGQQPCRYNQEPGWHTHAGHYVDLPVESIKPLYQFGYGLSYTEFEYSDFKIENIDNLISNEDDIKISVKIENKGIVKGAEIVQLYIRDIVASVTRPDILLKGFKKIELNPSEKKVLEFSIPFKDLAVMGVNKKWIVEPGDFKIMIGSNCSDTKNFKKCSGIVKYRD